MKQCTTNKNVLTLGYVAMRDKYVICILANENWVQIRIYEFCNC